MASPAILGTLAVLASASPPACFSQPPEPLKAPPPGITIAAEEGIIAHVDGRWLRVEPDAVRQTQAVLRYDLGGKAEDLGLLVERYVVSDGQVRRLLGQAEVVPSEAGVEFRISVPPGKDSVGQWYATVTDYKSRRQYPLTFSIGVPPDPEPGPDPPPEPTDAPFESEGFAVLVIEEGNDRSDLPPSQAAIFTSSDFHTYIRDRCDVLAGEPDREKYFYRIWDDDLTDSQLQYAPDKIKAAYKKIRPQAEQLPWIAISTGDGGWQGPLPDTIEETMELLRKWGDK